LVKRLNLQSLKKTLIVQSFRHTEAIVTDYVVLELLKSDGTVVHIRAYVVDRITSMAKVVVPPGIKDEFETATQWPEARFSGEVDILLGLEELALRPIRVELRGNLGIFVSPLSPTAVLGGRHEKIFPEQVILSQACNMLKRSAAPVAQQSFRIKQMDSLFQLGDSMGDYIPKTCSNCKKCSTCTFTGRSIIQKERIQLGYIQRRISHDKENNVFRVKYPFLEDPREFGMGVLRLPDYCVTLRPYQ
jgi:hypothetical protein